jgi:hypothetical protein
LLVFCGDSGFFSVFGFSFGVAVKKSLMISNGVLEGWSSWNQELGVKRYFIIRS